ncbi:hypothetical protein PHLGIDRAFT_384233 [Phlebiopsis gigantea 11061_1 CR5-6]|uniref:Uncharacterized protein n=1 Tax=Phlebiopsis gigantea (strain 11061_1 CR5-6) TaxID=745531 RepID=A0A0C3N9J7_PHLG1|nr:hypothetical protein PHLGIDRAFT_384233 [Phlebiopsis gigantea 11061_1 CR5-6]
MAMSSLSCFNSVGSSNESAVGKQRQLTQTITIIRERSQRSCISAGAESEGLGRMPLPESEDDSGHSIDGCDCCDDVVALSQIDGCRRKKSAAEAHVKSGQWRRKRISSTQGRAAVARPVIGDACHTVRERRGLRWGRCGGRRRLRRAILCGLDGSAIGALAAAHATQEKISAGFINIAPRSRAKTVVGAVLGHWLKAVRNTTRS